MKSLKQLYGNVEGYDFEEEYSIIERTIIHEREVLAHKPTYMDVFRGVDRVSHLRRGDWPLMSETYAIHHASFRLWSTRWSLDHQYLLYL